VSCVSYIQRGERKEARACQATHAQSKVPFFLSMSPLSFYICTLSSAVVNKHLCGCRDEVKGLCSEGKIKKSCIMR
jgi:hypothetical protein